LRGGRVDIGDRKTLPARAERPIRLPPSAFCDVFPGAVNSIPSRVGIALDIAIRIWRGAIARCRRLERASQEITAKRQVSIQSELLNADAPADCAPEVRAALAESCRQHGFRFLEMVSRRITIRFLFRGSRRLNAFYSVPERIQPSAR